jgi:hypothetical protein
MINSSTNGEQGNLSGPTGFNALMGMNIPPAALITEMNGRLYEGISAFNKDWVAFVNQCLKNNHELSKRIAVCETAEEIRSVYGDWYRKSAEHYLAGIAVMANNSNSLVHDTVAAVHGLVGKSVPIAEFHQC